MQHLNEQNLSTRPPVPVTPVSPSGPRSRQPARKVRTAAIVALVVLLATVFGTGLFAGRVFGTRSSGAVQPGSTPPVTVSGNTIEAQREAVIARVRPAVVQVNVVTASGEGLGSSVILDSRGFIVTKNYVIAGVRRIQVTLYGGTSLAAQLVGADPLDDLAVTAGALVVGVAASGPAATAGLKLGDVIVQVGIRPVTGVAAFADALLALSPGEGVAMSIYRGVEQLTIKVTLGEAQAP